MPHDPKTLKALVEAAAPPDMDLTFKSMFGGILGYADGKPLLSLSDVGLGIKLGGPAHAELLALPGARPVQYEPDQPPSKSYVCVPDAMLDDREALRDWIVRGADGLKAAPQKKRRN